MKPRTSDPVLHSLGDGGSHLQSPNPAISSLGEGGSHLSTSDSHLPSSAALAALSDLISRLDPQLPSRQPTVLAVVQLYCYHNLTIRQIARFCGCSVGTIFSRLARLRALTGWKLKWLVPRPPKTPI